jgi:glycosyltransferase involved in cell wall biosynthesis
MEILILAPFFPYPPRAGGEVRLYHFIRLLSQRHRVSLLSLIEERDQKWIGGLKGLCAQVEAVAVKMPEKAVFPSVQRVKRWGPRMGKMLCGMPFDVARFYLPALAERLSDMLRHRNYDLIHQEYMFMGSYLDRLGGRIGRARTVLGEIDLSFVPLHREFQIRRGVFRAAAYLRYISMKKYCIKIWNKFDLIVTASHTDKKKILGSAPNKKVAVIPNGVDIEYFQPAQGTPAEPSGNELVFVGSLGYWPNVDAIRYFCREILPYVLMQRPEATLTVIGAGAPEGLAQELPGCVRLTGYLEDIRPSVTRSAASRRRDKAQNSGGYGYGNSCGFNPCRLRGDRSGARQGSGRG